MLRADELGNSMYILKLIARFLLTPFPGFTTSLKQSMARTAFRRLGPGERVGLVNELRRLNIGPLDCAPAVKMRYMSRSDFKRLRSGAKEPGTIRWIDRYIAKDEVLFDIGANTGSYSLYTANRLEGRVRVYAFEASAITYASLIENVALNNLWRSVIPLNFALSNRTALASFVYASLDSGYGLHQGLSETDVYSKRDPLEDAQQVVLTTTLDALVFEYGLPAPNHVKLDVDGHELEILQGGAQVLRRTRPRSIQIEVDSRVPSHSGIVPLMESWGYAIVEECRHGGRSPVKDLIFVPSGQGDPGIEDFRQSPRSHRSA